MYYIYIHAQIVKIILSATYKQVNFSLAVSGDDATRAFENEKRYWNYTLRKCNENWKKCGHYKLVFFSRMIYTWMTFYSPRWGMKFICFYVIDDSDSILFSIIRRELFCKILNISSSSYKVMKSSMICCFCMKKRASTVKLMCLISIIYLTFIQFLVKIKSILICNLKFSSHLISRPTFYIVHGLR